MGVAAGPAAGSVGLSAGETGEMGDRKERKVAADPVLLTKSKVRKTAAKSNGNRLPF
jgi:hypothetical protein